MLHVFLGAAQGHDAVACSLLTGHEDVLLHIFATCAISTFLTVWSVVSRAFTDYGPQSSTPCLPKHQPGSAGSSPAP